MSVSIIWSYVLHAQVSAADEEGVDSGDGGYLLDVLDAFYGLDHGHDHHGVIHDS